MDLGRDTLIKIKLKTARHLINNGKTVYILIDGEFERYIKTRHDDISEYTAYALSGDVHGR